MVYNKTKRGLEKAAGIVGVVVSSIETLIFLYYAALTTSIMAYYGGVPIAYAWLLSEYLLFFAFSLISLIFYASVIKSPVQADGTIKQRKGRRICVVVFSFLSAQWVTMGLMIAVLCLKDLQTAVAEPSQSPQTHVSTPIQVPQTLDVKIAELKHLKELGVLDDETYKKAVNKILRDVL